jgi:hypothetical protein
MKGDDMTTKKKEPGGKGTCTFMGFLPEHHWLYGAGPIVAGRPILQPPPPKKPKKKSTDN